MSKNHSAENGTRPASGKKNDSATQKKDPVSGQNMKGDASVSDSKNCQIGRAHV